VGGIIHRWPPSVGGGFGCRQAFVFLQGAGPFRFSRFIAAFGREVLLAAARFQCPYWGTLSPGRAAHPPAFALSGPCTRYLLAFPATGSGGHPCPYGASFGILPHVACKAGVNPGGPRGAFKPAKPCSSHDAPCAPYCRVDSVHQKADIHTIQSRREALIKPGL